MFSWNTAKTNSSCCPTSLWQQCTASCFFFLTTMVLSTCCDPHFHSTSFQYFSFNSVAYVRVGPTSIDNKVPKFVLVFLFWKGSIAMLHICYGPKGILVHSISWSIRRIHCFWVLSAGQLCNLRTRPIHVATRTAIYGSRTIVDDATALRWSHEDCSTKAHSFDTSHCTQSD